MSTLVRLEMIKSLCHDGRLLITSSKGRGTEITTPPGGQNLGEITDINYFEETLSFIEYSRD